MAADTKSGKNMRGVKGFTLIELMIVMAIIGILSAIAVPSYQTGLIKAREAVLRENLYGLRSAIDQHYADLGRYPDSLKDLVDRKYLRDLPKDPFTNKNDTWITVAPTPDTNTGIPASGQGGSPVNLPSGGAAAPPTGLIYDVHSGSNLVGLNGTPYNEW
jgi:general secretion pathway protein G